MNKKLLFGLILTITTGQLAFGQTKVYNGSFNSSNFQGNATYNYTEQPDKRIFSGPFTFKTANNAVNISGSFQNDMKNGLWKFVLTNVSYTDLVMKYVITANVTGNFVNGNLDGIWNLSRTKVISFSSSGISSYYQNSLNALSYLFDGNTVDFKKSTTVTEKSTATFKDNHFSGSFSYSVNGGKSIVKGQFNEQGYFEGSWTVNYYQDGILHFQTRNYQNGVLVTIKNKDNSTGEVVTVYDKTVEVNEFFQNYSHSENVSKIDKTYYTLAEGKTQESSITFLEDVIEIWYNNTSLGKSAYLFEIERGTNKLTIYPERKIVIDEDRTEKLRQEEEEIANEIRRKQEAEEEEKRQIELTKKRQEQEKKWEEEKKIREFENSDFGKLQKAIKVEFTAWLEKGEFETQQDYEKRVKSNYQLEFDKIVQNQIVESKKYSIKVLSGTLSDYDIDNETFNVKLFGEYSRNIQTPPIIIKIPKNLAQNLKQKYGDEKASRGEPLLVHILDVSMINNNWVPSRLFIIFPNGERQTSYNYYEPYYNKYYWDQTKILDNGKGKYQLGYAGNIDLKAVSLKSIDTQFKNNSLDSGVFYFEWLLNDTNLNNLKFTIEAMGITLPF